MMKPTTENQHVFALAHSLQEDSDSTDYLLSSTTYYPWTTVNRDPDIHLCSVWH
jgi:hypothetical protein